MNIVDHARRRHSAKAFDPQRSIPPETVAQLRALLRYSPSSVNAQPWHFLMAHSDAGKARIARATEGNFAVNAPKILKASHVIVMCTRTMLDASYLATLLDQEARDGRFHDAQARDKQAKTRGYYATLHEINAHDTRPWLEKQIYIALGSLLLGAATLGVDACPMEGFDHAVLDAEFDLPAQGLASAVIVSLGYRGSDDFNATLPKSRLPETSLFTDL